MALSNATCLREVPYARLERLNWEAIVTLCPSSRWLELAQATYPCATSFVDIGANKGYTAAAMFSAWARRESGVKGPAHWWRKVYGDDAKKCGYCRDCREEAAPAAACVRRGAGAAGRVRVHSFDGSRAHVERNREAARRHFPRMSADWVLNWAAISNVSNTTALFEQGDSERLALARGTVASASRRMAATRRLEPVRVLTIDEYARQASLSHVDVLKIDAEGSDPLVLLGAWRTLRTVRLVYFEYAMVPIWAEVPLKELVADLGGLGFVCYFGGELALVRLSGCWRDEFDITHPNSTTFVSGDRALGSNVFCASRRRAPKLVEAYEAEAVGADKQLAPRRCRTGACKLGGSAKRPIVLGARLAAAQIRRQMRADGVPMQAWQPSDKGSSSSLDAFYAKREAAARLAARRRPRHSSASV